MNYRQQCEVAWWINKAFAVSGLEPASVKHAIEQLKSNGGIFQLGAD